MSKIAKVILLGLLILQNGMMLLRWIPVTSELGDMGRLWIRIIIPVVMIIQSLATAAFVWIVDKVLRDKREKGIKADGTFGTEDENVR